MDCFPDFCLACDKQTSEGLYCSQVCRLADLEQANSASSSPNTPSTFSFASLDWTSTHLSTGSPFYLTPALDFHSHKFGLSNDHQSCLTSPHDDTHFQETPLLHSPRRDRQPSASASASPHRMLSRSSSRTSLTSAISGISTPTPHCGLSEQARKELESYESSFDTVRERRRRSTQS